MTAPSLPDPAALLAVLGDRVRDVLVERDRPDPLLVGIRTGGVWVAEALHRRLAVVDPLGILDISFYRDDYSHVGIDPQVRPSSLPGSVDGRHVVLVDDVLHTGRTVRAALDEIFDYGRPASIMLAVLVDRGGRELPIQADAIGTSITTTADEHIELVGPEPLVLRRETRPGP